MCQELIYRIGLGMIPGIGSITAKKLVSYTGSPEAVFKERKEKLMKIPGIGKHMAERVAGSDILRKAEREAEYITDQKIRSMFYLDKDYPERLKNCQDGPVIFYIKGQADLEAAKTLSIVGTRNPSPYGLQACRRLISEIAKRGHQVLIVSGLAYGIDVCAHKAALENGLPTVAVLGHGLKHLYPSLHRKIAGSILEQGSLLTDFSSDEGPERKNFIKRNRIIAGITDATLVIESGPKGGALITADLADSYDRVVLALPGRVGDSKSSGCNMLIKSLRAAMFEGCDDLEYVLGWEKSQVHLLPVQKEIFGDLKPGEKRLLMYLSRERSASVDQLCIRSGITLDKIAVLLLELELKGMVISSPGNMYQRT